MPTLVKWYLDGVTAAGDVFMGYSVELRVHALRIPWSEWTLFSATGAVESRSAWRCSEPTEGADGVLRWSLPGLSLEGTWQRTGGVRPPPVSLFETSDTRIVWGLRSAAADFEVRLGQGLLTGRGYAERLVVELPGWQLPIRELRWGRFAGATTSLVWIEWQGPAPIARSWLDGVACDLSAVEAEGIRAGTTDLRFGPERTLRDAPLGKGALAGTRIGRFLLPRRIRRIHEARFLCRGWLNGPQGKSDEGWVVHERIVFP